MSTAEVTLGSVLTDLDASIGTAAYSGAVVEDLRSAIDDELTEAVDAAGIDPALFPVRVPKGRVTSVLACPSKALADLGGDIPPIHSLRGAVADVAAVIAAMSPRKPLELLDVLEGVAAIDPENVGIEMWRGSSKEEKAELREILEPLAAEVQATCSGVAIDWVVRPQFTSQAAFAGGRLLATARYDMLLSQPGRPRSAVVVEVKAGNAHSDHRADAFLYALLETLRTGYSPLAIVTISTGEPPVLIEEVTGGVLESASRRLVAASRVLIDMVANPTRPPPEQPGPHCVVCPRRATCSSASIAVDAS